MVVVVVLVVVLVVAAAAVVVCCCGDCRYCVFCARNIICKEHPHHRHPPCKMKKHHLCNNLQRAQAPHICPTPWSLRQKKTKANQVALVSSFFICFMRICIALQIFLPRKNTRTRDSSSGRVLKEKTAQKTCGTWQKAKKGWKRCTKHD